MQHFFHMYGRRNSIFLPGLRERIDYLNLGVCDLQDTVRKEQDSQIIGIALARIAARIFCIAEQFWEIPLVEAMSQKYPTVHCSYCQSYPCKCTEKRPNAILGPVSEKQLQWSLKQWQEHLSVLYGDKNRAKGIENLLNRLFKEIGELLSLQMRIPSMGISPCQIEEEFALELADALAWTIGIANFFEVDLEEEVYNRYGEYCWRCRQDPCTCINFNVEPMEWQ